MVFNDLAHPKPVCRISSILLVIPISILATSFLVVSTSMGVNGWISIVGIGSLGAFNVAGISSLLMELLYHFVREVEVVLLGSMLCEGGERW